MISDELRDTIVSRIRETCDPDRIILFGSHTRGDTDDDSDIDLLVIKSGVEHRRQEAVRIYRAMKGIRTPVDVVVATPEIIEEYKDCWYTVYHDAAKQGQVIYEKTR
jgi:predicted nucleotidyltransferase